LTALDSDPLLDHMTATRIAVTLDKALVRRLDALVKTRVYRTRGEAIEAAVTEKLGCRGSSRLARECAKLSRAEEQALAEEGMAADAQGWPEY
jgi:metal-responsive CopG/Arc/MetJ family transcriptional regulator